MQRECQAQRRVDSSDTEASIASVFSNIRVSWFHLPGALAAKCRRKLLESDNLRRVQLTTQGYARKCLLILDHKESDGYLGERSTCARRQLGSPTAAVGRARVKTGPRVEKAEAPGHRHLSVQSPARTTGSTGSYRLGTAEEPAPA